MPSRWKTSGLVGSRRARALVATAHYLLRTMLAMLRTGEVWRYANVTALAHDRESRAVDEEIHAGTRGGATKREVEMLATP